MSAPSPADAVDSTVAQRIQQNHAAEAAAQKPDAASFPPTDPGPLSRLSRDPIQVCFQFLSQDDLATTHRVCAVWRAAHDMERTKRWLFAQQIPRMIKRLAVELLSEDERAVLPAVQDLRKLLSIPHSPPIKQVLATKGILERLIVLVQWEHPVMQFEAAWALTNLASGSLSDDSSAQCQQVISAGALPIFMRMLANHRPEYRDAQEQAVWALGNLAGADCNARDAVLRVGAVPALLVLLTSDECRLSLMRNATWALSNCVRGKPAPSWDAVERILPVLTEIIAKGIDVEVIEDACWALAYLSDDSTPNNAHISAVIATGVVPHLVQLLKHPDSRILTPALRTLGNIVTGDEIQTNAVLNAGIVPVLRGLLSHPRKGVRKEAVWALSNITAGNSDQIQACLDGDLLSIVIDLLIANEDEEVSNECSHALANSLTGGTVEQICRLVSHSSLALVALNVSLASSKESVVRVSVDALHRVMRAGDELLAGVVDTDALSHELRDLVFAGEHPFAELVAGACRSNLCALKNSHDEEIADNARDILDR